MAAAKQKEEISSDFFFSLSRSIKKLDIIAAQHYQQQEQHVTLCERRREHISRVLAPNSRAKRSFVLDFFECKERERERFCFPAFGVEERQSQFARNERETNLLGTHKKIKKRKQ